MNNPRARSAVLRPDLDIPWSNRLVVAPIFNVLAPALFRPKTHFEGGSNAETTWKNHVESDAPTMVIMSHAEEVDTVLMAPIVQRNKALRKMRYETIVTAARKVRNLPYGAGWIVRHGGTSTVDRIFESPNETPEEKLVRQKNNLLHQDIGITVMRAGGNILIFPEGGTARRVKLPNGTFTKVPRKKDEMLPLQPGFARIIDALPPDTREKSRLMTVVSRYSGEGLPRLLNPTVLILDPVRPVDGDINTICRQGEELMAHAFQQVVQLDH